MPGFIIDLDGTMYAGTRPIPGAAEFIGRLKQEGHPFIYATNNSSKRPEQVAEHLHAVAGVEACPTEVLTSAQAAARYIADRQPGARVFVIGEDGLVHAAGEAGLIVTEERPDFVVQGIDRRFSYAKLEAAVRHIKSGAAYVLTNPDHLLPGEGGFHPGAGALAAAIRTASEAEPIVIGKPSPILLGMAVARLGLPASEAWVVGDNLRTDIAGGRAAGCRTALVLTGLATPDHADELIARSGVQPDLICRDLPELFDRSCR
ncbi:HAD-IIA family hydrolase [Paenibacillus sp. J2TS4]|uniref:HAD-IIA family hydrolase n=1 Tax=Paenibacillus sp. J2TS4 TaxID=2807194 RepID=UPI001AFEF705|nr:HAD-IIA family hydrolase [Paenibacillus sp. J2TS4]GIP31219.1 acid sugar phosphatase [Paenibacillus sp. J2TS4]